MASAKPPRPPDFDAATFSQRLHERVRTAEDKPYAVFDPKDDAGQSIGLPRWKQWVSKLRDVVTANAVFLDDVKEDLDAHKAADLTRHQTINSRLSALEAQQEIPFFPASG